ncbi:Mss4-like protein [Aspergillus welwitschiae]|uniref:Mss4-like protein n=1 Tax=Aspergillus welwitschiae TaxID=1341132 RepID=A0A3F3QH77_9EURO|nr:Mss4-like protein [Aspergillus welwitschiae]RDH38410.1 Mss4-like protein [Aspergillus welwitschiae]
MIPIPDTHQYKGTCHCGLSQFELHLSHPLKTVHACRCTLCAKKGYLWLFPAEQEFQVTRGAGELVCYSGDGSHGEHMFCPTCGTGILVRGHKMPSGEVGVGVNARALLGVNPFKLRVESYTPHNTSHGSSPTEPAHINTEIPSEKIYTGSCHCTAVRLSIQTKPLPEIEVKEDNCSICQRNANICIYPHRSQVTLHGEESLTEYCFGRGFTGHQFCKICGVQVGMKLHGPPQSVVDSLPPEKQEIVKEKLAIVPIRVAVLDGVEWADLKVERTDEGTEGYVVG